MWIQAFRFTVSGIIALTIVAAPWAYYAHRANETRNFRVVRPGVLYRSGQMTKSGMKQIIHDYGIKTVITFRTARDGEDTHPDIEEKRLCRGKGLNYYRIAYTGCWTQNKGENSADDRVQRFCEIMSNPNNHPVLVHCYAGKHRTGAYCAVYRMEFNNWGNEKAIEEMKKLGYDNIEEHQDLFQYLMEYQPRFRRIE